MASFWPSSLAAYRDQGLGEPWPEILGCQSMSVKQTVKAGKLEAAYRVLASHTQGPELHPQHSIDMTQGCILSSQHSGGGRRRIRSSRLPRDSVSLLTFCVG